MFILEVSSVSYVSTLMLYAGHVEMKEIWYLMSIKIQSWLGNICEQWCCFQGFPDSSVGKESACNAGDSVSIPGSGRSAREGIGYPLQYSWTFLVAQLVKNLPALWDTWVWPLGWEDPLEKGKATHFSILAWKIPWTYSPWCHKELDKTERLSLHLSLSMSCFTFTPILNYHINI